MQVIHGCEVYGIDVDEQTRCGHWHSPLDIIAIKFKCCGHWYPCFDCHTAVADHEPSVWPSSEFGAKAILCGACGYQLAINEYLAADNSCPTCAAAFNPGCAKHYDLYFAI
jgi:uncharacterized CHY-type Zn-finger protein